MFGRGIALLVFSITHLNFLASGILDCSGVLNASGIEIKAENVSRGYLFYQPLLQDCFRAHPYNTKQLPIQVGTLAQPFKIDYFVSIFHMIQLSSDGKFISMADINFRWTDSYRIWNITQIPTKVMHVPVNEIWYPIFILSN